MPSPFRGSAGKKNEAKRSSGTSSRDVPRLETASNEDQFAQLRERNLLRRRERSEEADASVDYKYDAWYGTYGVVPLVDAPLTLLLPLRTIETALKSAGQ